MASTPAYWTNKKCRPSLQAVSQLSLYQAPHGFGAPHRGFPAFLAPSNCLKNRQATQANIGAAVHDVEKKTIASTT